MTGTGTNIPTQGPDLTTPADTALRKYSEWEALRADPGFWVALIHDTQTQLGRADLTPAAVDALTLLADGARALLALNRTETTP